MVANTTMSANQVVSGTFGAVWVNENKLANVKKFKAEKKAKYEEVEISEELGSDKKIVGYEITGTMSLSKIDSFFAKLLDDAWNAGKTPDITIIARTSDPAANGKEGISLTGVNFDSLTLLDFEVKKLGEEEMSFSARTSKYTDLI